MNLGKSPPSCKMAVVSFSAIKASPGLRLDAQYYLGPDPIQAQAEVARARTGLIRAQQRLANAEQTLAESKVLPPHGAVPLNQPNGDNP